MLKLHLIGYILEYDSALEVLDDSN